MYSFRHLLRCCNLQLQCPLCSSRVSSETFPPNCTFRFQLKDGSPILEIKNYSNYRRKGSPWYTKTHHHFRAPIFILAKTTHVLPLYISSYHLTTTLIYFIFLNSFTSPTVSYKYICYFAIIRVQSLLSWQPLWTFENEI